MDTALYKCLLLLLLLQIKENHQENLCTAVLLIIPLRKTFFFLTKVILIQGAFKNIQGLQWKIQGLFKDIPQFFNFQGLFKARANDVKLDDDG